MAEEPIPTSEAQPTDSAPAQTAADAVSEALGMADASATDAPTHGSAEAKPGPARDERGRFAAREEESVAEGAQTKEGAEPGQADEEPDKSEDDRPAQESSDEDLIKAMPKRTAERFSELRSERDTFKSRAEQAEQTLGTFQEHLRSTGASPQEFGVLFQYAQLVHSPDPTDLERALEILERERNAVARKLGKDVPGVDVLDEHPDLAQAVSEFQVSREWAVQVARARNIEKQEAQRRQQALTTQQAQTQDQQAIDAARVQLQGLEQRLRADPDYARKYELLKPRIAWATENLPPHLWAPDFEQAYGLIGNAATEARRDLPRTPQPLRPNGGMGGGRAEPKTALDAVSMALGME